MFRMVHEPRNFVCDKFHTTFIQISDDDGQRTFIAHITISYLNPIMPRMASLSIVRYRKFSNHSSFGGIILGVNIER